MCWDADAIGRGARGIGGGVAVVHAGRRGAIVGDEDIRAAARTGGELNNTVGCIRVHSGAFGEV